MTSYSVRFTGSKAQKDQQALEQCRFYLGDKFDSKAKLLAEYIQQSESKTKAYRVMQFYCDMMGIRGYHPVRVMFKHCMNLELKK